MGLSCIQQRSQCWSAAKSFDIDCGEDKLSCSFPVLTRYGLHSVIILRALMDPIGRYEDTCQNLRKKTRLCDTAHWRANGVI